MSKIKEAVFELLSTQLARSISDEDLESTFEDLGADSLDVVEVALALEDRFNFEIPDESADNIERVKDVINLVESLVDA